VKWLSAFQPQRSDPDLRPVPLGFLGLIVLGGLLLMLPAMHAPGRSLAWLDAFFVSTSAVCVTGLSTVNPAETFSPLGLGVVLALVQIGGVGIVTASLALVMLSGERLSLAHEGAVAATIGRLQRARPGELFAYSCAVVAVCELAGTAALYWRLREVNPTAGAGELAWVAAFHSVSAFCNAGFSTFPEAQLQRHYGLTAVLSKRPDGDRLKIEEANAALVLAEVSELLLVAVREKLNRFERDCGMRR
jgi:trk system potassium uptake protein TrkH